MNCEQKCRFCEIFNGNYNFTIVDKPIVENENFVILSTIGALVEGWVLIIPKFHTFSMREYYNDGEFVSFVNKAKKIISEKYDSPVLLFEHGASSYDSTTSCGTGHAHLHLLPMKESFIQQLDSDRAWQTINIRDLEDEVKEREYLLYTEVKDGLIEEGTWYLSILENSISQYFRKQIAEKLGIPNKFDYKENINLQISESTYYNLKKERWYE